MQKLKVVIDTNVWIKGYIFANSNPYCAKIMSWVKDDKFIVVFAQDTIGELIYMLKQIFCRVYQGNSDVGLKIIQDVLKYFYKGVTVNTINTIAPKCNDRNDDMFIKCAYESKADYIISDDYTSGMLNIEGLRAVDTKEFVNIYHDVMKQVAIGKQ